MCRAFKLQFYMEQDCHFDNCHEKIFGENFDNCHKKIFGENFYNGYEKIFGEIKHV